MAERTRKDERSGLLRRWLGDSLVSLGKGAIGTSEAALGAADLVTNGAAGQWVDEAGRYWSDKTGLSGLGYDPERARQYLNTLYSPEEQAARAAVEDARGFLGTADAMRRNPSTLAHVGIEAAPIVASALIGGGGAANLASRAATKLPNVVGKLGTPLAQGAVRLAGASATEGAYGAAQEAQQIQREGGAPVWDSMNDVATRGAVDAAIGLAGHAVGPGRRLVGNLKAGRPFAEGVGAMVANDLRRGADASIRADLGRGVRGVISEAGPENAMQTAVGGFMPAARREKEEKKRRGAAQ